MAYPTPTTVELLSVSPQEAVIMMFNAAYGIDIPPKRGRVSAPSVDENGNATVTVSIRAPLSPDENLIFTGSKVFTYSLADLNTFVGGEVNDFIPVLPTTTQTLADLIAARFGIVNDPNDFIIEQIDNSAPKPYILTANPLSLRWKGLVPFHAITGV